MHIPSQISRKFQSIIDLFEDSTASLRRFPHSIIIAILGTILFITISFEEQLGLSEETLLSIVRIALVLMGLFPASITIKLLEEQYSWNQKQKLMGYLALALIAGVIYSIIPLKNADPYEWEIARVYITIQIIYLSVFFIPFVRIGEANGFWQFTRHLIERLIFTVLFAGVLFAGISLTMASIDFLFDITIEDNYYGRIWIFCAGIIASWFFISGIPKNIHELNNQKNYPELLQKFVKFILVPLVTIYTVVLYAYGSKIIFTNVWPSGETVYLIAGYIITGLITYLLAYPLLRESASARKFGNLWLITLIPVLLLYFSAIFLRVEQYGITAERYFVIVLGIFYLLTCAYLLISKKKNIIFIPILLSLLAIIGNFGPTSAYAISKWSQSGRLERLAIAEQILINGKFIKNKFIIKDDKNREEIEKITRYLIEQYGPESIERWLPEGIEKETIMASLLDDKRLSKNDTSPRRAFFKNSNQENLIALKGYDYLVNMDSNAYANAIFAIQGKSYYAKINTSGLEIRRITHQNADFDRGSVLIASNDIYSNLKASITQGGNGVVVQNNLNENELSFTGNAENITYKLVVNEMTIDLTSNTIEQPYKASLFLQTKE